MTIEDHNRLMDVEDIQLRIEQREEHHIFETYFKKLDTLCQKILELFFQQKSMTEIAEQLDLKNEHTARTRKYRCQKTLEKMVRADARFKEMI